jgi:hypothetical protein
MKCTKEYRCGMFTNNAASFIPVLSPWRGAKNGRDETRISSRRVNKENSMKHYLAPLAVAALLTACGGGGGGATPVADAEAAANTASTAFFQSILSIITGSTSETGMPVSAESVASGSSETQQASPL